MSDLKSFKSILTHVGYNQATINTDGNWLDPNGDKVDLCDYTPDKLTATIIFVHRGYSFHFEAEFNAADALIAIGSYEKI